MSLIKQTLNYIHDSSCLQSLLITLAAKRRRKGMVIILCVCVCVCVCVSVCVCVCSQNSGKTTNIGGSNELLADLKLYKDQK